ncbi:hypothetical protein MSG28_012950 [Choristoneura fumiferana]|uniref:Uncharacterized protein n=1 Tax=Choristoneura fumiferana TaxID=7141 RepID=A0ACC0KSE8_CHOFU|nr:hypothetical protein MSG28_012950 [Choristoneura fumiferana]
MDGETGAQCCGGLEWDQVRCSTDAEDPIPEGPLPPDKIGRFPWIGVIQHDFYIGGKMVFAITSAVLIHPAYALASAMDMARIDRKTLTYVIRTNFNLVGRKPHRRDGGRGRVADGAERRRLRSVTNNTHMILWHSATKKYSIDIIDYTLHPEYETTTLASFALVELMTAGETRPAHPAPVLPVCMPIKGAGAYDNLYAVKMTDESGELQKEVYQMDYIENDDCNTFYDKAELTYKKMSPVYQLCAAAHASRKPCVWDAGAALVTRQNWGFWKLLGFSVRGPGCGAPSRFLSIISYLEWIDERISTVPFEDLPDETLPFVMRSVSPIEIYMYLANPTEHQGQCMGRQRGSVMYKDESHLHINKNFAQGFYFCVLPVMTYGSETWALTMGLMRKLKVTQRAMEKSMLGVPLRDRIRNDIRSRTKVSVARVASFSCMRLKIESYARSSAQLWLEHHCHRDLTGYRGPDHKLHQCFVYFKTTAYLEFRFFFTGNCYLEMTLFGRDQLPPNKLNPWVTVENTLPWWPTDGRLLRWSWFVPVTSWWYWM